MKQVKTKTVYDRIAAANTQKELEAAWATLSDEEQSRISQIYATAPTSDLKAIAWVQTQLPEMDVDVIWFEFAKLPSTNSKQAPVWVQRVKKLVDPF